MKRTEIRKVVRQIISEMDSELSNTETPSIEAKKEIPSTTDNKNDIKAKLEMYNKLKEIESKHYKTKDKEMVKEMVREILRK